MPNYLPLLLDGALLTVELTVCAAVLALVLALLAGFGMLAESAWLRTPSRIYTEVFRGAPTLVLLFWFVYSLPFLGIELSHFVAAVIALALSIGAYEAEIVRGAVQAVPRGQVEAAIALNMSPWLRTRKIIFPQAVVAMIPPYSGMTVQLLKSTALVSLVGLSDLTFAGDVVNNTRNEPLEIYTLILVGYFVVAVTITRALRLAEYLASGWRREQTAIGPRRNKSLRHMRDSGHG